MDVRVKINELRLKRGWSLSQMARKIGVSVTSVYNWYNETNSMPSVKVLEDVCALFGITMSELFADVDTDNLSPRELTLLEYFNRLSLAKQNAIIELVKNFD